MKKKTLFKNKYRIESIRLKHWDYSDPGFYFITICTRDRENMFGEIIDGKMILNKYGFIAKYYLKQIHSHFRFIRIDSFIVMPNHIHLILQIKYKPRHRHYRSGRDVALLRLYNDDDKNANENANTNKMSIISPKPGSVSAIIRSYKSICKRIINLNYKHSDFNWQLRFYDNIVRVDNDLFRIREYIKDNPPNWENDLNNKKTSI